LKSLIKAKSLYFRHIRIILADRGDLQEIAKRIVYVILSLYLKTELKTKLPQLLVTCYVPDRARRSWADNLRSTISREAKLST